MNITFETSMFLEKSRKVSLPTKQQRVITRCTEIYSMDPTFKLTEKKIKGQRWRLKWSVYEIGDACTEVSSNEASNVCTMNVETVSLFSAVSAISCFDKLTTLTGQNCSQSMHDN